MCGIAGIVRFNSDKLITTSELKIMSDTLVHRGPDGEGQWVSDCGQVGLSHRRLSIIDLSDNGSQPMHYLERYVITFNGEIYNYIELREELQKAGYVFTSNSDTEVLMAMYDKYGTDCLLALDGMFSFVLYDKHLRKIFCARDRFGEKPFFYTLIPNQEFLFASEMKAIHALKGKPDFNQKMLFNYLAFGYVDDRTTLTETFYAGIHNLPHASFLLLDLATGKKEVKKYWTLSVSHDQRLPENASENVKELFLKGLQRRMRSDVSVGSSLSGGLDSSLIVCSISEILKRISNTAESRNIHNSQQTFSARFPGFARDEGTYMQLVIDKTGVSPHFTYPTQETLLNELDKVAYHQEEPFGSSSILAQYEVMKLAKEKGVTVLLDGQGADEIFAGYHGYYNVFFRELKKSDPVLYRKELAAYELLHANNMVNPKIKKSLGQYLRSYLPSYVDRFRFYKFYLHQKRNKYFTDDFFQEQKEHYVRFHNSFDRLNDELHYSSMQGDLQVLLRYADRNSMAHSREVRLPFLFHELVEYVFSLPSTCKIHDGWTKWIMRSTFSDVLPEAICWRKDKIGYEPPQKSWMADKRVKEKMISATEKLVKDRILNKNALAKMPSEYSTSERGNNEWAHLMVSYLY
jgi:asparagine synthase (glutamine-hydrolysing)